MAYDFRLPDLGEGVHEGEVLRWLVHEGERVNEDQPLVEVMTDKVTAEIPSPRAGTVLKICVPEGAVVPVGTTMVTIGEPDEAERDGRRTEAPAAIASPAAAPNGGPATGGAGRVLAVPAVRQLARDLGVELESVHPTGPGGRITFSDVRALAASRQGGTAAEPAPPEPRAPGRPAAPISRPPGTERRIPLRGMRRRIAEHLVQATQLTAPFTYVDEADFTELVSLRERVRPLADERGVKLTYLPFVITAVVAALKRFPMLNGTVDEATGDLIVRDEYHVGIAVEVEEGLIVPVIRNAERLGILDLAREVQRLGQAARAGKLTRGEIQGGTFSITSLGPRGGLMATPIINTPEVGILGIHKIAPRPVARDGQVVIRQIANISLTFDHRYIDGAVGADFAGALIQYIQDPAMMLFWMSELRE